jgi:hypothetical protein
VSYVPFPTSYQRGPSKETNRMKKNQWQLGTWMLPHSAHLPVEVELADGTVERRSTVSGDWRQVVRWRMVDKQAGEVQRKRK